VTADGATAAATSSRAAKPSTPAGTPSRTSATASPSTADAVAAPVAPAVPRAPADDAPGPVLAALPGQAPPPTEAGLRASLDPFLRAAGLGGRVSVDVADVASGETLLSRARVVMVFWDPGIRRASPPPAPLRERLVAVLP